MAQITTFVLLACLIENVFSLFDNRALLCSIVIGDYLYIDGGEITTWNGTGTGDNATTGDIVTVPSKFVCICASKTSH